MSIRIKTAALILAVFCVSSCNASQTEKAQFQVAKLVYDKEAGMLIVRNIESARVVSEIELDKRNDTLALKVRSRCLILNRVKAATSAVKLPSEINFVEVEGVVFPLSELRASAGNSEEPEVVFNPKHFPFTGKIN